ncbi:ThiF family adenylyltransferase [Pedobacter metabolipauper]|uniref:Molybdopterin-synthase adenylyltransferase n=1 Tax=Pedobacter metabolipauper TaxID=425513 RepID=A0A4R6SYG9_9SPHI|nr:ThiF family adenylyltransferase [Pedobacter metabolipauper]TDQ11045.1 adenylyltransferase/sulfurtransferase [Pedobacter metabolipauper]
MESERYNRQIILSGFGKEAQLRLLAAKVLVIGAGGLGCPALQYLAAAGVGHIGIADDDHISLSNLHRQILFSTADVGQLKTAVAANRLREMNPGIDIVTYPISVTKNNVLDLLENYDLILDGTDNFESRYLINDACALLSKPLVFAAVSGYEGQLAILNVADDQGLRTNYRDLFPVQPGAGEIPNCAENGVLGVLPGIIGTMAAAETIKLITGIGKPLINELLHYNLLTQAQYKMSISPAQDYTLPKTKTDFLKMEYQDSCGLSTGYTEINADQLQALQQERSVLLIDVRERHEVPILNKEIFTQVPMSEFDNFLLADIDAENIVLICQHGIRSVAAAEALQEKYGDSKNLYSLKGGIIKWRDYFSTT